MRNTRTIMIPKEITTYTCDICGVSTENNKGCCGTRFIMECDLCDNDCCRDCRKFFTEDYSGDDYPDGIMACKNCIPYAKELWEWGVQNAGRYDDIVELILDHHKELKNNG